MKSTIVVGGRHFHLLNSFCPGKGMLSDRRFYFGGSVGKIALMRSKANDERLSPRTRLYYKLESAANQLTGQMWKQHDKETRKVA